MTLLLAAMAAIYLRGWFRERAAVEYLAAFLALESPTQEAEPGLRFHQRPAPARAWEPDFTVTLLITAMATIYLHGWFPPRAAVEYLAAFLALESPMQEAAPGLRHHQHPAPAREAMP